MQNKFWNSFAEKYDGFISRFAQETYNRIFDLIHSELKPSDKVLEIGTGTGLIAFNVAPKVKEMVSTDFAPEMIRVAKEKLAQSELTNLSFKVSDANSIDFSDNSFDIAIASNVFHLIPNTENALSELNRLVKTNGKIILPTYCHGQNLKSRIISAIMGLSGFKAVNRWSISQFKTFVEKGGFKIEKAEIIKDKIPLLFLVASKN